jgi:uncharacterized protein (TIGR03083 family)
VAAVRRSHDRLTRLVGSRDVPDLVQPSACSDWNVAQVLSHLGSQAEIFSMFLDAALEGTEPPGREAFPPVWDKWNVKPPAEQVTDSIAANERFVRRLEDLDEAALTGLHLELFGSQRDAAGLLRMRLSEHAIHTWDVEVVFEPAAQVASDAVDLLIDGLPEMAPRAGKAATEARRVVVTTTQPERRFLLDTGGVFIQPAGAAAADASLEMDAEGFLRLIYGRLSGERPPHGPVRTDGISIEDLEAVFPGF